MISRLFTKPWEHKPLVILFGWLGSSSRYFAKYEQLWRGLGGLPVGIRPTILQTAVPSLGDQAVLRFLADVNRVYGSHCLATGQCQPVFVHTFSNAGFLAFGAALHLASLLDALPPLPGATGQLAGAEAGQFGDDSDALPPAAAGMGSSPSSMASTTKLWPPRRLGPAAAQLGPRMEWCEQQQQQQREQQGQGREQQWRQSRVLGDPGALATLLAFRSTLGYASGILVDSAPSQATPAIWSRGVLSAALGQSAVDIESRYPLALRALRSLTSSYLEAKAVQRRYAEVQRAWLDRVPACPQLYLYSETDALIPAEDVRAFIHTQKERGVAVQSRCWADSHHCEHYRTHPQEYTQLVRDFMQHCTLRGGAGWRSTPVAATAAVG